MARFNLRGVAAFAGGAAAALVASRFLPPLMAQAAGAARAAAGRDPFDALEQDHRVILSLLSRMEQSADAGAFQRTQLLLRLKRRLSAHALAEEDVIYPMLHEQAQELGDTMRLYGEHAEMKMRLHALEQMAKDDPRWIETARDLKALVERHARQEEEVDFPKLRNALDEQAMTSLSGQVQREKALLL